MSEPVERLQRADRAADDPLVVAGWGENLRLAEELAGALREHGIAAVVDPDQMRTVDVNRDGAQRSFAVLVPRERAADADAVLAALQGREGDASDDEIRRALEEPVELARDERRIPTGMWLVGVLVLAAFVMWVLLMA